MGLLYVTLLLPFGSSHRAVRADESPAGRDPTRSEACAVCHPAIYAEHVQNTHGSAFVDEEARIATREFRRANCVRCHTPRPVFETGFGMTPVERRHDLEEGNTCMSCHAKAGYDYGRFRGGDECKSAFDERVGTVEACATCHRIAGTPEQWEHAASGRLAGNVCVACHMPLVERPVAVGMPKRPVRSHQFPGSRSEDQLRRAYDYVARIDGDEVVVTITNSGAGHDFPTGSVQRSLESLVVVRDAEGQAVVTDREVFKLPYAKPTGLEFPRSLQIPSGRSREHRVPIPVGAGTVECELFFKLYYPIEDGHPTLSRRLEWHTLPFSGLTPSPHVPWGLTGDLPGLPAVTPTDAADPHGLAKYAHPPPGTEVVEVPQGSTPQDLARLVSLLQFPVPGARAAARERLLRLRADAVPALVEGLAHWSDETRDESAALLLKLGGPAVAPLRAALRDERFYARSEARGVLARMRLEPEERAGVREGLVADLFRPEPLDRRSAADALGTLADAAAAPALRALLGDPDADVVAAAAQALARLEDRASVPEMAAAFRRARYPESRRDLAGALASLGSAEGIPWLLASLDYRDDVIRRTCFDALFEATGLHESYDPGAPRPQRREAIARLQSAWAASDGAGSLRRAPPVDPADQDRAWAMVEALGGGTDTLPGGNDVELLARLVAMGSAAVPALTQGLSFPSGFVEKRALLCEALGKIGDARAAPYLVRALRDDDLSVASWACWALSTTGDEAAVPALRAWSRRLEALADAGRPRSVPKDLETMLLCAAWTRERVGDELSAGERSSLGGAQENATSPPPSRAIELIATTETAPVPVPTSPADAIAKAQQLRQQDYYEDAVRVLRYADARFGPTAAVRLETAWNLLMIGEEDVTRDAEKSRIDTEVAVARKAFDEAQAMDPDVPDQDLLQAKLLRYEGADVQARAQLRSLVARHPDDPAVHREYADFAFTRGEWGTAEREYRALAALRPSDGWPILYATICDHWLERPVSDLETGYLTAVRLLPEEPMPLERLAALYAGDGRKGVALLERVIAERPESAQARVVLARLLWSGAAPDRDRAERLLREAIAIRPQSPAAHLEFARLLEAGGQLSEAVRHEVDALLLADRTGIAEPSDALDRLLQDPRVQEAVPAELRARAWAAVVARNPSDERYGRDASQAAK